MKLRSEWDDAARRLIGEAADLSPEEIVLDAPLANYGIDSLMEYELMSSAPDLFGMLDVWKLPIPVTGQDLVEYMMLNALAKECSDASQVLVRLS